MIEEFLQKGTDKYLLFFNENYDIQYLKRFVINDNIVLANAKIKKLDFSNHQNVLFILSFLDYAERFKLLEAFQILYTIAKNNNLIIGERQEAANLFLLNFILKTDHFNKFAEFSQKLQTAYEKEEDNETKILITFANYFSNVINNTGEFHPDIISNVIDKIYENKSVFSFLQIPFIDKLISINIGNYLEGDVIIQKYIEELIRKDKFIEYNPNKYLIEENTVYSNFLINSANDFNSIRQLSVNLYKQIPDSQKYFDALQRGVKILTDYEELLAYITGYSEMHKAKLLKAFDCLKQTDFYSKDIEIFDWACGQGLASMVYLDYTKSKKHTKISLLEPSEIALKRGSLHVKKINPNVLTTTINKDLDNVQQSDLITSNDTPKLHLFSNIIDVDLFSLSKLLDLLQTSFKGENYFVCVSPYITDLKTARIDSFVSYFKKNPTFCLYDSVNIKAGDWVPGKNWSIVMRVFKVVL